ncbi:MAG TPA: hypothetical protein PKD09_04825 [Aggregatilinea sp.]|uniref:hypothetical protein n=1 Tax=Aggregatilinea sp. TaxID=2806333 RepID=UPI002B635C52|nr:hypothetical protein [Aggregatilinea sp.]HML20948.1 hypothetical protein [Aggregatilinea sp.]
MLIEWNELRHYIQKHYLSLGTLVGEKVEHKKFGTGTVIKIERPFFYVKYSDRTRCHIFQNTITHDFKPIEASEKLDDAIKQGQKLALETERKRRQALDIERARRREFGVYISPLVELSKRILKTKIQAEIDHPILSSSDIELALQWSNSPDLRNFSTGHIDKAFIQEKFEKHTELGRLLSARSAEKAAATFLRNYGFTVEDIAIKQLREPQTLGWRTHDLEIDGFPIDVKNSRRSEWNKDAYTEHCIPRFKQNQLNEHVAIVGVLSQYLWPCHILEPSAAHCDTGVTVLGGTSLSRISLLKHEFEKTGFLKIDFSALSNHNQFLPPWIFEFSSAFYQHRDPSIAEAQQWFLSDSRIARVWQKRKNDLVNPSANVLPLLIAAEMDFEASWADGLLQQWELALISKINSWKKQIGLSLPFLFCSILSHFLEMATLPTGVSNYEPQDYRRLLFFDSCSSDMPLFIHDPLKTVEVLVDTLTTLWQAKQADIRRFHIFRLKELNILQGKETEADTLWKTLVAHCGGWIGGRKCGYTPLILGDVDYCPNCGKLICPECGFCSWECSREQPPAFPSGEDQNIL